MSSRASLSSTMALLALVGCSCTTEPPVDLSDAGGDGGTSDGGPMDAGRDAPIPPGDPGRILSVDSIGEVAIPGLEDRVEVVYTELGVPHVYATNEHDLRVVQGYLAARDRFFQMTLYRFNGRGEVTSLVGDGGLGTDVTTRSQGLREVSDRICASLTAEQEMRMDAYVDGVNAFVMNVRANLERPPEEFNAFRVLLGFRSAGEAMPLMDRVGLCGIAATIVFQTGFDQNDVLASAAETAAATAFAGDPFETLRRDGILVDVLTRADPARPTLSVECTSPPCYGPETGTLMSRAEPLHRPALAPGARGGLPAEMLARMTDAIERYGIHPSRGADFGSNAWAVSALGTSDGSSVFAADGHLALSVPTLIFYQLGLDTTVFGDAATGRHQMGMGIPGIVQLGPGTNGHVMWSQTYLNADAADWYREEITLDANGVPVSTTFQGTQHPLTVVEESYTIANVPALMSVGRTEMHPRFTTFDGRHLMSVEGRTPAENETPGPGESILWIGGARVIPGDTDGDGHVSGLSLDYLAYDVSNVLRMIDDFGTAATVEDMVDATRRNVGYTQNFLFSDDTGSVAYTAYNGTPCRGYLRPSGSPTGWATGANPRRVIDGTTYGGFTVPLDASGMPDEAAGASDPSRCIVPYTMWPRSQDPDRGFVLTANNDVAGTTLDGDLDDDAYYLGTQYAAGYRADTIHTRLASLVASHGATVESLADVQADHHSVTGEEYLPVLHDAIVRARGLADGGGSLDADEQRLVDVYVAHRAAIDEADGRLTAWLAAGAIAYSGVETFYDPDGATHATDAVAAMIHVEWFRQLLAHVFADEGVPGAFEFDPRTQYLDSLRRIVDGRGAGNPEALASFNPATNESIFFDVRGTPAVERSDEMFVASLAAALDALAAPLADDGTGGFGTTTQSAWVYGLRHQVRFESILTLFAGNVSGVDLLAGQFKIDTRRLPLAPSLPAGDPRAGLRWFPRPGDFDNVDAANASFAIGTDYTYGYGPNMRMVVRLHDGVVEGQNILPGGQSARTASPHFDDQAAYWLGNRTIPLRYTVEEVVAGAEGRESFHP
ncbi:MAG: penicillin acylase family protein [Sandaracinus sp.]